MSKSFTHQALQDISSLMSELIKLQQSDYAESTKLMVWRGFLLNLGGYNLSDSDYIEENR